MLKGALVHSVKTEQALRQQMITVFEEMTAGNWKRVLMIIKKVSIISTVAHWDS